MSAILDSYNKTKLFNQIAGNIAKGDIKLQLKLMFEEFEETLKANCQFIMSESGDGKDVHIWDNLAWSGHLPTKINLVELLDGAIDMKVINDGLLQILEAKGFDINKALRKVGDNNLSKYPKEKPDMSQYPDGWTVTHNVQNDMWIIKDENGKIRKPLNFVPVDLSDCVPDSI